MPGAVAFTCYGLLGRLAFGMLGVSLLTATVDRRGSYALAGAVSAAGLVGVALGLPLLGRLVDRYGQARVTVPAALISAVPRLALAVLIPGGAPAWVLLGCAFAASAAPNLGGMARSRWAHLHRADPAARHTANSLEQALDELTFMSGPVLGVLLCSSLFPEAGLLAATALNTVGALLFAAQRRTEPPLAPPVPRPLANTGETRTTSTGRSPLRAPATVLLVAVFLTVGAVFGSLEITTLACAAARGRQSSAGLLLALLAAGSCGSGLVFGLLPARRAPATRFLCGLAAMACLLTLPLLVGVLGGGLAPLALALLVTGTGTAPTMVTGMTLLQNVLPAGTLNEGMALAVSGIVTGISAGSALGGLAAQGGHPGAGYAIAAAAGLLALLIATARRRLLRRPAVATTATATAITATATATAPKIPAALSASARTLPPWRTGSTTGGATRPARKPKGPK
ncbi:MFS transporter [Kitasatospora nipponensis]|uniref:MFS transporter n=1 Tax=Kitasatospora nipponensis TaxID=258049 RepID=A0ABN1VUA8_9ACTN